MSVMVQALLLSLVGFTCLATAMVRHVGDVLAQPLAGWRRVAAQAAGVALLGWALAACLAAWTPSVGAAIWLGVLSLAALALGGLLTYASRRVTLAVVTLSGVVALLLA